MPGLSGWNTLDETPGTHLSSSTPEKTISDVAVLFIVQTKLQPVGKMRTFSLKHLN